MSNRKTSDWIQSFLKATSNTEPAKLFRQWTAVSTLAAVMQRKVYLAWGSETWYPNMYVILVGPPGSRKGTAMRVGQKMLRELGHITLASDATSRQALIRALVSSSADEFIEIDSRRSKRYNHCSLTIYSKELSVFLGADNKQNLQMMADLCDWFDCDPSWTYETLARDKETVHNVWVNLFAGTTPQAIRNNLPADAVGTGLGSRMVFVYEPRKGKRVSFPTIDNELYDKLVLDLEALYSVAGGFTVDSIVKDMYDIWYQKEDEDPPFKGPSLQHYLTRRPTHLMKMCMIMSASRSNELRITEDDFVSALDLLYNTEVKMERTFSGFGKAQTAELVDRIIEFIAIKRRVTRKELVKQFYQDVDDLKTIDTIIDKLQVPGFIRVEVNGRVTTIILDDEELGARYRNGT